MTQTATTLAADVTADAETIDVVAPVSNALVDGYFVQIDTEILEVQYRGMGTDPGVRRGSLGTARAAHSADDDVTPVTVVVQTDPPTAPPSATAGGDPTPPFDYIQPTEPVSPNDGDTWLRLDVAGGVAELLYYDADEGYFFGSVPTRLNSRFASGKDAGVSTNADGSASTVTLAVSQGAVDAGIVAFAQSGGESSLTATATSIALVTTYVLMGSLPTSDPLIAGALYTDGATSAGVPKALMVSGGPA